MGLEEPIDIVSDWLLTPWWLDCYKSVKKVPRPVKIDVFFLVTDVLALDNTIPHTGFAELAHGKKTGSYSHYFLTMPVGFQP